MTSNKGAGYTSSSMGAAGASGAAAAAAALGGGSAFPGAGGPRGPVPQLLKPEDDGPHGKIRALNKQVHDLLEKSSVAGTKEEDPQKALELAKECAKRERTLCRTREQNGKADDIDLDLQYAVTLNLADRHDKAGQDQEALDLYAQIVKNKNYPEGGKLRVNMGKVYFDRGEFPSAIKMYRMALDHISHEQKGVRFKVMRNIGIAFVKMGQYVDAARAFSDVMSVEPDFTSGYNLVICHYATGDKEKMKESFVKLLSLRAFEPEDEEEEDDEEKEDDDTVGDELTRYLRTQQLDCHRKILAAAKLIGTTIGGGSLERGYEYLADEMHRFGYAILANELEMELALSHLKSKTPEGMKEGKRRLLEFEKKEHALKAKAATNLSWLYFHEGDYENAQKYADLSVATDRYDARALVNKGNCHLQRGDLEGARDLFLEAVGVQADCHEAIYNLGLAYIKLGAYEDALAAFRKIHAMTPDNAEVLYQLGNVSDMLGDFPAAIKHLEILHAKVSTDPGILARLGAIHAAIGDEAKALHYYQESHRLYPSDMDVLRWLGTFYVKTGNWEKARELYQLACMIKPKDVKYRLLVATCLRKVGNVNDALAAYETIHNVYPDNVECLRHLCRLYGDLGRTKDVDECQVKLRKVEAEDGDGGVGGFANELAAMGVGDGAAGEGGSGANEGLVFLDPTLTASPEASRPSLGGGAGGDDIDLPGM